MNTSLPEIITRLDVHGRECYTLKLPPIQNQKIAEWEAQWQVESFPDKDNSIGFYRSYVRRDVYYVDTQDSYARDLAKKGIEEANYYIGTQEHKEAFAYLLRNIADDFHSPVGGTPKMKAMKSCLLAAPESLMAFSLCYRAFDEDLEEAWRFAKIDEAEQFDAKEAFHFYRVEEKAQIFKYYKRLKRLRISRL